MCRYRLERIPKMKCNSILCHPEYIILRRITKCSTDSKGERYVIEAEDDIKGYNNMEYKVVHHIPGTIPATKKENIHTKSYQNNCIISRQIKLQLVLQKRQEVAWQYYQHHTTKAFYSFTERRKPMPNIY